MTHDLLLAAAGGLASILLVPLAGLAAKGLVRLPAAIGTLFAKAEASPLGQKHPKALLASEVLAAHVMDAFLGLGLKAIADAKAEGRLDAALLEKIKTDVRTQVAQFVTLENALEICKEMGQSFTDPDRARQYVTALIDARTAALAGKAIASNPAVPAPAPAASTGGAADPSKTSAP